MIIRFKTGLIIAMLNVGNDNFWFENSASSLKIILSQNKIYYLK